MPPRQTMLFTATWGKDVQKVARAWKGEPTRVSFGDAASGKLTANKDVTQTVEIVESWRDKKVKAIERLKALHKMQFSEDHRVPSYQESLRRGGQRVVVRRPEM